MVGKAATATKAGASAAAPRGGRRGKRASIVLAGLIIPQLVMFWPSLAGQKVLLPLDLLQWAQVGLPGLARDQTFFPHNAILSDEVLVIEPWRRFAVAEVRAGRLPLWNPYIFCGAPFLAANQSGVFSPFRVLDYLFPGTWVIAWTQLLKSLVAGLGAYLFLRCAMRLDLLAAALGAWIFPLSGGMVQWLGYPISFVLAWLPWLLWAADAAVRRPKRFGGPALGVLTASAALSGHSATAVQVLLATACYGVWRAVHEHAWQARSTRRLLAAAAALAGGFVLGGLLAAPQLLPTAEYLRTSHRLEQRQAGNLDSLSLGWQALAQLVLPDCYGSERSNSTYLYDHRNRLESAASGYAGLVALLFLAPLALGHRERRADAWFWLVLGALAAAPILDVPVVRGVFQTYPLSTLRNNRLVFLTAWSTLTLAAIGFDSLRHSNVRWTRWYWLAVAVGVALGVWFLCRAVAPPEPFASTRNAAARLQFETNHLVGSLLCAIAIGFWIAVAARRIAVRPGLDILALLVIAELIWSAYGFNTQADPALDYPASPFVRRLQQAPAGRICGVLCLPPNLNMPLGLRDIRGYDGVDPTYYLDLIDCFRAPHTKAESDSDAMTSWVIPRDSQVPDMLNLRYLVYAGTPPPGVKAAIAGDNRWAFENSACLDRVFVPRRVETILDKAERLRRLDSAQFDPRAVALLEANVSLEHEARGAGRIVRETPNEVTIQLKMETPGCVVLGDLWYPGWKAYLNGQEQPVLRANHALRGVMAPAGEHELVYRFEPASFYNGLGLAALAATGLCFWTIAVGWFAQRRRGAASTG